MDIFQAVILGTVQGFTEFLPISSQAHLYLVPYLSGWDYQGLKFDVALHLGTLFAVLLLFGKDYWQFITHERKMIWYLVIGTLPAVIAGLILRPYVEETFRHPLIMVFTLAGFGLLLLLADKKSQTKNISTLNWKIALFIGIAQAMAIVPGVSRSGITMTAAILLASMSRESAARFSFLLSGPIIFGAGLFELAEMKTIGLPFIVGFISAALSGVIAIKFLLNYLTKHGFVIFVWYRLLLAGIILTVYLIR